MNRVWIISALIYSYFVAGYINNSMTNSISVLTVALVEEGSIQVDPYLFDHREVATRNGHYFSGMPPGTSFFLIPVYLLVKSTLFFLPESLEKKCDLMIKNAMSKKYSTIGESQKRFSVLLLHIYAVLFLSIPLAIGLGIGFCKIYSHLGFKNSSLLMILCTFLMLGTPLADFSSTFFHNTLAATLLWLVFVRLCLNFNSPYKYSTLFLMGLTLGALPSIDYPALSYSGIVFIASMLSIPSAQRKKGVITLGFGFLVPFCLLLLYQWVAFGSPWTTSYQMRALEPVNYLFKNNTGSQIWSFLPTWPKILRVFSDSKINLWIYHPLLPLGLIACLYHFSKSSSFKHRVIWMTTFLVMFGNFCYFSAIPLKINPAGGSYGARYTIYSVPFALLACTSAFQWVYQKYSKWPLLCFFTLASIPAWIYLFYGSPNRPLEEYFNLFKSVGPTNYTLLKAYEAGLLNPPTYSYLGLITLLGVCFWVWKTPV